MSEGKVPETPESKAESAARAKLGREIYQKALIGLMDSRQVKSRSYYGHLILNMRVTFVQGAHPIKTAGVSVTRGINLFINLDYFSKQSVERAQEVLEHECLHVTHDHFGLMKEDSSDSMFINICSDAAINEFLPLLQDTGVSVERLNKEMGLSLKKQQATKYYMNELQPKYDEQKKQIQDMIEKMESGDHSGWKDSETSDPIRQAAIRSAVNNAVKAAGGIGSVSSEVAMAINKLNESQVNWKHLFRNLIGQIITTENVSTRKKMNRRYGIEVPGTKRKRTAKIVYCRDTSGSVPESALVQFESELDSIGRMGMEVYLIDADSEVKSVEKWTRYRKPHVKGRGGTAYQPAITAAMNLKPDLIIYAGDMDASDIPADPGVPFLWVVVGNSQPPGKFGKIINVKG